MSDFIDNKLNPDTGIDFSKAQKLPWSGSTCDTYKAISQRRKVFVKRLKEEYRNKPLYLSAFDKEYDIGINLNHPSLPNYREFHGDYIVMDFIDGKTLIEMIEVKDQWLSKEKNVVKILRQLINVIDYLHLHHVAHCDIKTDNIMITASNRDLMLIDLDKCYTDWRNDTPGSPSTFGLNMQKKGEMSMDYYCVALVLEKIQSVFPKLKIPHFKEILTACKNENISADDILEIVDSKPFSNKKYWLYGLAFLTICGILAVIIVNPRTEKEFDDELVTNGTVVPELMTDSFKESQKMQISTLNTPSVSQDKKSSISLPIGQTPVIENTPAIEYTDEQKSEILNENFQPIFNRLHAGLTELQSIKQDTTTSWLIMMNKIEDFADIEQPAIEKAYGLVTKLFPETQPTEVAKTIALSSVYIDYMHRSDSVQRNFSAEMKKRRDARR